MITAVCIKIVKIFPNLMLSECHKHISNIHVLFGHAEVSSKNVFFSHLDSLPPGFVKTAANRYSVISLREDLIDPTILRSYLESMPVSHY